MTKRRTEIKFCEKALWCAISLVFPLFSLSGCASTRKTVDINIKRLPSQLIVEPTGIAPAETNDIDAILSEINVRNRTVEDSQDWIEDSYGTLRIRPLESVHKEDYEKYARYLDDGSVYIIVHPAFFPFFHTSKKFTRHAHRPYTKRNVVEKLLDRRTSSYRLAVLQAQERRLRDFLEFKSTQNKLIVFVLPKDYVRNKGYTYRKELDEYARYLNEVTNGSASMLYIESRSANRGYLKKKDMVLLMRFLISIDPDKILIGGSYVGRCLESFYTHFTDKFGEDGIFIIPEVSAISPRDLNKRFSKNLLEPDGSLNVAVATDYLKRDVYDVQRSEPNVMNLSR